MRLVPAQARVRVHGRPDMPMCTRLDIEWYVLLCCAPFALSSSRLSPPGVSGHVRDDNGDALPNATVRVTGAYSEQLNTTAAGYFSALLPEGVYTVHASLAGFQSRSEKVRVGPGAHVDASVVLENVNHSVELSYHSGAGAGELLNGLARHYTEISRYYSIGGTDVDIPCLEITAGIHDKTGTLTKPSVLFLGAVRPQELVSRELLLQLASHLAGRYATDSEVARLLEDYRVFIVPALDRRHRHHVPTCNNSTPEPDLDQSFSDDVTPAAAGRSGLPAESRALIGWLAERRPVRTLVVRAGGEAVTFPYAAPHRDRHRGALATGDEQTFRSLASQYVHVEGTLANGTGRCDGRGAGALSGGVGHQADVHPHTGSLVDYLYGSNLTLPLSVFVSCCAGPEPAQLSALWRHHRPAMLDFIAHQQGVHGFVTDEKNAPLPAATLLVNGSQFTTYTGADGQFWRTLNTGSFTLRVSAAGYLSVEKLVSVFEGRPTHLQVVLKRDKLVAGMPRMVLIILLGSLGLVAVVVCMLCATLCTSRGRRRRGGGKRGGYGFYQLMQPDNKTLLYADDSDDEKLGQFHDVPLTRAKRAALDGSEASPFVRPFRDLPSSDSSSDEEEEVFIATASQKYTRR